MNINFKHPFAIHYKDPRFKFYFDDPKHNYRGDFDYWFDEKRLNDEKHELPNNVSYYPSDHREICCYNPLFVPYFNFYRNSNEVINKKDIKGIPKSFYPTIEEIKKSEHYNKNKTDNYYQTLIRKYSYDSYKQFIDNIVNKCCKMNKLEALNEITFGKYENTKYLTLNVRKYFKSHKANHYIKFINVMNDVYALNELDKAIGGKEIGQIIIYVGKFHLNVYNDFINRTYEMKIKIMNVWDTMNTEYKNS